MLTIRFTIVTVLIVSILAISNGEPIIAYDHQHRVRRQAGPKPGGVGLAGPLGIALLAASFLFPLAPTIKLKILEECNKLNPNKPLPPGINQAVMKACQKLQG